MTAPPRPPSRRASRPLAVTGFTLIEMLIVIGIIMALLGMSLMAINSMGEKTKLRQTVALINQISGAISSYNITTVTLGDGKVYVAWYVSGGTTENPLGLLDGDPAIDPSFSDTLRSAAADADYRGPKAHLNTIIPPRHIDSETGRIIDAWGHPLRVLDINVDGDDNPYAGDTPLNDLVSSSGLGIWSVGPSGDPLYTSDNQTSWGSKENR